MMEPRRWGKYVPNAWWPDGHSADDWRTGLPERRIIIQLMIRYETATYRTEVRVLATFSHGGEA
jgi:hypothetical protein